MVARMQYPRIGLFIAFLIMGLCHAEQPRYHGADGNACQRCLTHYYAAARDSIVQAWTVLDTMRSMTIESKDRVVFAHKMFDDIITVTHTLSGLTASCQFCVDYYRAHSEDIVYLEEILAYMTEAFEAVFTLPHASGEEKLLHSLMAGIVALMKTIRQEVGFTPVRSLR